MAELQTHHLRGIENQISSLARITDVVSGQVDTVQRQQSEMDGRLLSLSELVNDFIAKDALAKQLQLAETRLVKVRAEIETEFGHYGEVRRRTTGVLQALDTGVVSHETIQDTTEDVMVATPRYWLAPALVSLAAWSRNDRRLAELALAEALRRDVAKTSLFLSLVLRRHRRDAAATRWLAQFFARQDPQALGREFIVVLDAVASGAYGIAGRAVATEEINRWLEELQQEHGFLQQQVDRWTDALMALKPAPSSGRFRHLEQHVQEWPQLADLLATAHMHGNVIAHFEAIFEGELQMPAQLETAMDDLLDRLVKDFDVEELPLRRKAAELEAIIDHDGDTARAQHDARMAQAALDDTVDFPSMLTNAAMRPKEAGASRASERLAVALSREWIVRAHDGITAAGRDSMPDEVRVTVEGWSGTIADGTNAEDLGRALRTHIDRETQQQIAAVRFGAGGWTAAVVGGVAIAGGLVALNVIIIAIGLALAGYAFWSYKQLDKRREALRLRGEERKTKAVHILNATLAELVDYHGAWGEEDARAEDARDLLLSISPSETLSVSAHDAREVL